VIRSMTLRRVLLIGVLFFSSVLAFAEEGKKSSGEKKTTSINFEDELIEGEVKKPELMYLLQKKQFNFKKLIKLRENFIPEMNSTAEDISRGKE